MKVHFMPGVSYGGRRSFGLSLWNAQHLNYRLGLDFAAGTDSCVVAFAGLAGTWVLRVLPGTEIITAAAGHLLELRTPEGMLVRYRAKASKAPAKG